MNRIIDDLASFYEAGLTTIMKIDKPTCERDLVYEGTR